MHLLRSYFEKYPEDVEKVVLSIKGAYGIKTGPIGTAEGIRASVDEALKGLSGTKTIDVFEMGMYIALSCAVSDTIRLTRLFV